MAAGRWFEIEHVKNWDDNPNRLNPIRGDQLDMLVKIAAATWQPDDRVIDLAAGTGHVLEMLLGALPSARATAVDYSPVVLQHAEKRLAKHVSQLEFLEHDLNEPIIPKLDAASFAIAISVQSFHHFDDDDRKRQLSDIYQLLKPGGLFLVHDRFAVADPALLPDYQALWQRLGAIHDLELPDEPLQPASGTPGERAADLPWFLAQLAALGFVAAPFAQYGTRTLIAARKPL